MPKKKIKKSEQHIKNEAKIRAYFIELWHVFYESPENRQQVLDAFDDLISQTSSKPHIAEWIQDIKEAFLKSEVQNGK